MISLSALIFSLSILLPAAGEKTSLNGYVEFRRGSVLMVDGQRVECDSRTRLKGSRHLNEIPLGYEAKVKGNRRSDGVVRASQIKVKPNGVSMFEPEVLQATNEIEKTWVKEGVMYTETSDGKRQVIGKIHSSGPQVARVRKILSSLVPPYVEPEDLRVRVVETKEWNASAMGNGAIWVYSGLIQDMNDTELAVILGHELAHYTHEHTRRNARKSMLLQMLAAGASIGSSAAGGAAGSAVSLGSMLGLTAFQSGYSRDLEDQADRVGLRYAYEAGYDVHKAPGLWERFREKYGESDSVTNFFIGSHSRPSDRIRNLNREIRLNYLSQ